LNLEINATPIFHRNYSSDKRVVINRGGTRSSKTYSIAQLALLFLFTGYVKPGVRLNKGVWTTARKWSVTLDSTVIRDFQEILDENSLYDFVEHNKTKKTYRFKRGVHDRIVEFIGVDNEQKARGAKRDILHCNEANELSWEEYKQLNRRTLHRVVIDFNPDDEDIWINKELEQVRQYTAKDVDVIVSTYLDNTFLPEELKKEIEYEREADPESWEVYGKGNYGKRKGIIFNNWDIVDSIPSGVERKGIGLDFGFTNDPTAAIDVYMTDGEIWLDELIYEQALTNPMIADKLMQYGRAEVIADSSEPKSIAEIKTQRINITGAEKGPDSVNSSIDILKRFKIHITARSQNLIKEFKRYKWKTDKNGNALNEPVDFMNHGIDAVRYFALNKLSKYKKYNGKYTVV
jgi:phage terminase large subunit